jgi:hypothetical protein
VKAEALRDQILAARDMGSLNPEATLAVLAAALLAESEDGYTRDAAPGILQRARQVSPELLALSANELTSQLAAIMANFWDEFLKGTWQGPGDPPAYVAPEVVAARKAQEEQEQGQNRKEATDYLSDAQVAVGALGIDEKEFPTPEDETAKPRPKIDVGKFVHGLIYRAPALKAEQAPAAPGWLTPPLIDKGNPDFAIFDHDILQIVGTRKLSGEQAWKKLEERGYDRGRIIAAIYNVRKVAQDQIAQSDQILSFIRSDYETRIEPVVKAAVLLGHAISVVNSFYAPLPLPADSEDAGSVSRPVYRKAKHRRGA